jgi:hypothetical protein
VGEELRVEQFEWGSVAVGWDIYVVGCFWGYDIIPTTALKNCENLFTLYMM